MNDQPENIIAGGHIFKRSQLQDFVDDINHVPTVKASHLLKLKHLFHASVTMRVDYGPALKVLGVLSSQMDLRALESLNLGSNEISLIDSLYDAQRTIEKKHLQ